VEKISPEMSQDVFCSFLHGMCIKEEGNVPLVQEYEQYKFHYSVVVTCFYNHLTRKCRNVMNLVITWTVTI
jgi:hypothetical protein